MHLDDSRTNRLAFAGISALTVLTWYALPDAVRSRRVRGVLKAGLLVVTAAGTAMIPRVFPETGSLAPALDDLSDPSRTALAVGSAAAATAGTVWFEKAVFAYGERRRARGVQCAHTPLALAMAVATGAAVLIDWARVAGTLAPGKN